MKHGSSRIEDLIKNEWWVSPPGSGSGLLSPKVELASISPFLRLELLICLINKNRYLLFDFN